VICVGRYPCLEHDGCICAETGSVRSKHLQARASRRRRHAICYMFENVQVQAPPDYEVMP